MAIFSLYVNENHLTCQRALNQSKRQGDDQRVVVNSLIRQEALCNRRERRGGRKRTTNTDLVHRSITAVENCDQIQTESYLKLLRSYRELSIVNETTELDNQYDANEQTSIINHNHNEAQRPDNKYNVCMNDIDSHVSSNQRRSRNVWRQASPIRRRDRKP